MGHVFFDRYSNTWYASAGLGLICYSPSLQDGVSRFCGWECVYTHSFDGTYWLFQQCQKDPPAPPPPCQTCGNPPSQNECRGQDQQPGNSSVGVCGRTVNADIMLPGVEVLGLSSRVSLLYSGETVMPEKIVTAFGEDSKAPGTLSQLVHQFSLGANGHSQSVFLVPEDETHRIVVRIPITLSNGQILPSGQYMVNQATFRGYSDISMANYPSQLFFSSRNLFLFIVNHSTSPIGRGWGFGGHSHAHRQSVDGSWFITQADGSYEYYQMVEGVLKPPLGVFSTITYEEGDPEVVLRAKSGETTIYDAQTGLLQREVDRNGNATRYFYDTEGRLVRVEDPKGGAILLTYDLSGHLQAVADQTGRASQFEHNIQGDLTAFVDPSGARTEFTYDQYGRLLTKRDPRGVVTGYEYNETGRVTAIVDQFGNRSLMTGGREDTLTPPSDPMHPISMDKEISYKAVSSVTDRLGRVRTSQADFFNSPVKHVNKDGVSTEILRNNDNQIVQSTTGTQVEQFEYNLSGDVALISVNQRQTFIDYENAYHLPISISVQTDGSGGHRTTAMEYDEHGNLIAQTDPGGSRSAFTYTPDGQVATMTDAVGNLTQFFYDARGNLSRLVEPSGRETVFTRDAAGRVTRVQDAASRERLYTYDAMNRLTEATDPQGNVTRYFYDAIGNLTELRDAMGRSTLWRYDNRNRLIEKENPLGEITRYAYDAEDNLTLVTLPDGKTIGYQYDAMDRLVRKEADQVVTYSYDTTLDLTLRVENEMARIDYTYDNQHNLLTDRLELFWGTPLSRVFDQRFTRNLAGEPLMNALRLNPFERADDFVFEVRRSFNNSGLPTLAELEGAQNTLWSFRYFYDSAHRRTVIEKADGTNTRYAYNPNSELVALAHEFAQQESLTEAPFVPGQFVTTRAALSASGVVSDTVGVLSARVNGEALSLSAQGVFESALPLAPGPNQLTVEAQDVSGYTSSATATITRVADAQAEQAARTLRLIYDLDAVGNILAITDSRGVAARYGYDSLDRLSSALRTAAAVQGLSVSAPARVAAPEQYAYDPLGNRTASHLSAAHAHNPANRLTEDDGYLYEYDANGNRRTRMHKQTGVLEEYFHDRENRLMGYAAWQGGGLLRRARYFYDPLGRRMAKAVDADGDGPLGPRITLWHYENEDVVMQEDCGGYTGSMEAFAAPGVPQDCLVSRVWLHGPGADEPLAMVRDENSDGVLSASEALVYHTDHLGSILALTDLSGSVKNSYYYDSFGNTTRAEDGQGGVISASEALSLSHYAYTGREMDLESGLYYYRARYYDSNAGVFIEEDPVFSENLYPYVGNGPIKFTDPFGLINLCDPFVDAIAGCAIGVLVGRSLQACLIGAIAMGGLGYVCTVVGAGAQQNSAIPKAKTTVQRFNKRQNPINQYADCDKLTNDHKAKCRCLKRNGADKETLKDAHCSKEDCKEPIGTPSPIADM